MTTGAGPRTGTEMMPRPLGDRPPSALLSARGERADHELVYAGFSLGVLPAQKLAQTRPGARGALLFYSCVPTSESETTWPADVPVQIHAIERVLDFLRDR